MEWRTYYQNRYYIGSFISLFSPRLDGDGEMGWEILQSLFIGLIIRRPQV